MNKNTKIIGLATLAFFIFIYSIYKMEEPQRLRRIKQIEQEQRVEEKHIEDSIVKVQDSIKAIESYKDSIQIIKKYTSEPNTAGGVDLNIIWKNKSKRVIKYARFQVSAINAVNDEVYSELDYYNLPNYVRVTGPIKPNQVNGYGTYWECVWYNSTIKRCIIRSVELEYMDGTKVEIPM